MAGVGFGAAQQAADLSGTWQLNVERSHWGKHPKPTSGTVVIEHHEPAFKYSGKIGLEIGSETGDDRRAFCKRMIRELKRNGPSGEVSWTEVYDRQ